MGIDYQAIEDVRAADHLDGLQTLDVLSRGGWVGLRRLSYAHDVMAVAAERVFSMFRNLPADQMPKPLPPDDPSGVHLFGRRANEDSVRQKMLGIAKSAGVEAGQRAHR